MAIKKYLRSVIFFINKNPLNRYLYNKEIEKRSHMTLTDIYNLSKPIQVFSPFTNEFNPSNDWYGHAKHFKKYLNLPQNYQFKFIIEHGTYPTEQVAEIELEADLPTFLTYSDYRVGVLKQHRNYAFSVGPFIHYVEGVFSKEKIALEKKRIGKNLLVFPSHSLSYIIQNYDNDWFIGKIKKLAKDFDNVRICLYWTDIQLGLHKYYLDLGFECVTAGHILDPNFLPRLKSIIEIADLTISNDIGTYVGYSVYLNKPHIIFHKFPKLQANKKWSEFNYIFWASKPYQKLLKEFTKVNYNITPAQRNLANKYYGGKSNIKTKEEFRKIISFTEQVYQNRKS